jgi:uncharacterized protein
MKIIDGSLRLAATDLSNFLACRHLTRLETLKVRRNLKGVKQSSPFSEQLAVKGQQHEEQVLASFDPEHWSVTTIPKSFEVPDSEKFAQTIAAMEAGYDVVYQGVLLVDLPDGTKLFGNPDFLVRATRLTSNDLKEAAAGYEVVDAKLARSAKARAVLQCAFYSALLAETQGHEPARFHLALGDGETMSFRVADYAAYERSIRRYFDQFVVEQIGAYPDVEPYPEPVEHCAICNWRGACREKRKKDDDLSLVASMPTGQRLALKAQGVSSRRVFAALEVLPKVKGDASSLKRSHLQARLQVKSEDAGKILHELIDPDRDDKGELVPNRGLLALPEPSPGDLFFDIEGARYYSEDGKEFGLQYLFGIVDSSRLDGDGKPEYRQIWAFDRNGEKKAFEDLVDFIEGRRAEHPGLHVFHYNHYEPTAIDHLTELHETREEAVGRLMGRFATREDEIDDLFRGGVFVDLYRVVRQGVRIGTESYSLKQVEKPAGYQRNVDLDDATAKLIRFESDLDDGTAQDDTEARSVVAGYNEDDCRATVALRDWLETLRLKLEATIGPLARPVPPDEPAVTTDAEILHLKRQLTDGLPEEADDRSDPEAAKALLADLLEWHRREAKPAWWRFFRLRELSSAELVDEPDAIGALSGGEEVGVEKRSVVRRFRFPPQEHGFGTGKQAQDPVSGKTWTVVAVDEARGTIDMKIGSREAPLPTAVVETGPIGTKNQESRLCELADDVVQSGFDPPDARTALLLRSHPYTEGRPEQASSTDPASATDEARATILYLHNSYLPVQGPPGTGKTWTAAHAILDLVAKKRIVGVTAPSHAVICNLLNQIVEVAAKSGQAVRIGQKPGEDPRFIHPDAEALDHEPLLAKVEAKELDVVAGTAWLWSRSEFATSVDTLFVDEAGQFSLANVLAIAGAATNLVLVGDPQQLAQPSQGAHPPGAGVSALGHILGDHDTMPTSAGVFLDKTYRMHPDLRRYTSQTFYDGRLDGVDGLKHQRISGAGWNLPRTGLAFVEVDHQGNTNSSSEEASEVLSLVDRLVGTPWTNAAQGTADLTKEDVLVVTPFNAQVREIDQALAPAGFGEVRVGTVDKFQGQEAPVVIYSMASSTAADAPRGLEFLFDLHRLNVATSRARALAFIVASPDLLRVVCKTPRQMVLANALCRGSEAQPNVPEPTLTGPNQ